MVLTVNGDYFLNSINQLIVVMVKCGVLFEVRAKFLSTIKMSVGFRLVVSMHPDGPGTGHLDTGSLGFPLSLSKC
jgi:hypothetical protein